jgi:hypothetical protein
MRFQGSARRSAWAALLGVCALLLLVVMTPAQQITETRDALQKQDEEFARLYKEWTGDPKFGSPLVDHLPVADGIPTPKTILGYHIGAPRKLTYYADILKYYRALAAATPRVKVETIGKSDEGRELIVVWVSSEENMKALQQNRDNLGKLADPRGLQEEQIRRLIAATKPNYHVMGGLHSGETGASEMLMELVYRLAAENSPFITQIRNHVYVSVTPVADADGRDRYVDWFYLGLEASQSAAAAPAAAAGAAPGGQGRGQGAGIGSLPYWGKYAYHDNNRDINIALQQMRAITDWYFTAHPPIMHDLHESQSLLYTYSGGPPQNPNLDPLLFFELPWFADWEVAQMTKWNMPGVYTHSFMDGWSPGYLGSVAYNHNGLMKMYETQSGRDMVAAASGAVESGRGGAAGAGGEAQGRSATAGAARAGGSGTRGGGAERGTGPGVAAAASGAAESGRGSGAGAAAGAQGRSSAAGAAGAGASGTRGGGAERGTGSGVAAAASEAMGSGAGRSATPQTTVSPAIPSAAGRAGAPAGGDRGAGGPPAEGRAGGVPSGRGGTQEREWYRGIPVPPNAAVNFSRRNNVNYMETGVLSALQLTSMSPGIIVENFYIKTRNSMEEGKTKAPYGFVIPVQRDMTKAAELVRILRIQGIEVGIAAREFKLGDAVYAAGSYVIKRDQPYGRLAKNLLEKQVYPDSRLTTYDDSGWTMGYLMGVNVREIADPAILKVNVTPVAQVALEGRIVGTGTAGLAVAHFGSNHMISFRYRLKNLPMRIAERSFAAEGVEFPAGSFVISGQITPEVRTSVMQAGLTAAALSALPFVPMHDAGVPRIAIYSQWSGTQDLGWYRLAFDNFGIPYDLIFKEQVKQGNLRAKYDVILMAAQTISRQSVLQPPAARPQPYQKSEKYKFLGMYGETPDMSGGFGQEGADEFAKFLEGGGTLIAAAGAVRFPIEFGWARSVDLEQVSGLTAQRPITLAEISRPDHPIFYGYAEKTIPIKYVGNTVLRVGVADQAQILARYVGGDSSVLSGLMVGADQLRARPFAIDIPNASNGKGRVLLFANNPICRWQNHGEFNMIFNGIMNWKYVPPAPSLPVNAPGGRGAMAGER